MISKYKEIKDSTLVEEGISSIKTCVDENILKDKLSGGIINLESINHRGIKYKILHNDFNSKRSCRESVGDFWSRVDSAEIDISKELDKMKTLPFFINYLDEEDHPNYNIITTSVADYSYKSTPFGDVYYSPRFQDDKYIYRYVILTKGVRNEAYRLLKNSKSLLLTEHQIIRELSIDLSPGWEHFMLFKNRLDELILRRRIM